MTLQRRLDALEPSLSPTQLVLRWLAEAHAFGDMEPYVASLLAQDSPVVPLDRLAREAANGARTAMRGKRPELIEAAVRSALRETLFRFELVMRINVTAHELVDREGLIDAALGAQVALVTSREKREPKGLVWLGQLRDLLLSRVDELHASQEARTLVEQRYLDGRGALFPDLASPWDEQVKGTEISAAMAVRLAELDGVARTVSPDPKALSCRTTELVADLVEPAKAEALEKLGEDHRALGIAQEWVRTRIVSTVTDLGKSAAGKNR
jgi:hypothetical protein